MVLWRPLADMCLVRDTEDPIGSKPWRRHVAKKAPLQLLEVTPGRNSYCPSIIERRFPNTIDLNSEVTKTNGGSSKVTSRGGKMQGYKAGFTAGLPRSRQSLYETYRASGSFRCRRRSDVVRGRLNKWWHYKGWDALALLPTPKTLSRIHGNGRLNPIHTLHIPTENQTRLSVKSRLFNPVELGGRALLCIILFGCFPIFDLLG